MRKRIDALCQIGSCSQKNCAIYVFLFSTLHSFNTFAQFHSLSFSFPERILCVNPHCKLDTLRVQWRFALKVISLNVRLPVAQLAQFNVLIFARPRGRGRAKDEKECT